MTADLQPMAVGRGSLAAHAEAAGEAAVERVRAAAEPLKGARVLHVSAAGPPSRTPELLASAVPLELDAGVEVEWRVLFGDGEVGEAIAALTGGLQGAEIALPEGAFAAYLDACRKLGAALEAEGFDLIVLHDPGALGLAAAAGPAVWRCHLDCSSADDEAVGLASPLAGECAAVAFADPSFAAEGLGGDGARTVAPGIDPLARHNLELSARLAGRVVRPLGVDLGRPYVCHAMRLDRWKDPHATIEAFRLAREELPELQLVIAASLEARDPDGWRALHEISDYAGDTPGLLVLTSYEGVGSLELGALQRLARVGLLRSLHEGFGLAASEFLWKGTPVVAAPAGGVALQVRDEVDGYFAERSEDVAVRMVELVSDPGLGIELGEAGREHVRERFLVTRMVEDELALLASAAERGGATVDAQ